MDQQITRIGSLFGHSEIFVFDFTFKTCDPYGKSVKHIELLPIGDGTIRFETVSIGSS